MNETTTEIADVRTVIPFEEDWLASWQEELDAKWFNHAANYLLDTLPTIKGPDGIEVVEKQIEGTTISIVRHPIYNSVYLQTIEHSYPYTWARYQVESVANLSIRSQRRLKDQAWVATRHSGTPMKFDRSFSVLGPPLKLDQLLFSVLHDELADLPMLSRQ